MAEVGFEKRREKAGYARERWIVVTQKSLPQYLTSYVPLSPNLGEGLEVRYHSWPVSQYLLWPECQRWRWGRRTAEFI